MLTLEQFETLAGEWVAFIAKKSKKNRYTHESYRRILSEGGTETVAHILYWIQQGKGGDWNNALSVLSRQQPNFRSPSGVDETNRMWVQKYGGS